MFGAGDPNNPMGRLLGDLMKVLSPGQGGGGGGDTWFEAARTLAHGVATDGGPEENADPLVRMAFEELGRVAELHVTNATGISLSSGGSQLSFDTVGPGQWSFLALEAYRPTLQLMVEAQQQAAAAAPSPSTDLSDLDDPTDGLGGFLSQFALTLGPVLLGMQFGSAAGHLARRAFGQYALPLPWPESNTLVLVPANVAQFAEDWSLPLQEVQLWVCVRELTMHAVLTRPGVRARSCGCWGTRRPTPPRRSGRSSTSSATGWAIRTCSRTCSRTPSRSWPTSSAPNSATSPTR